MRLLLLPVLLLLALPGLAGDRGLNLITIDVVPWASRDVGGRPVGVFPEVVRELGARTGLAMRMTFEPFARIDRELESGRQDCTIIIWDEARARIVERGAVVAPHRLGVVAGRGVELERYEDLRPLTISVLRGLVIEPTFDADETIRKDFDTDYLMGIRKIAHRRVDAIAGAITTIRHLALRQGLDGHLGNQLVLAEVPLVLQCSKRSDQLHQMPLLNKAIEEMVRDGTIDRIRRDHGF